MSDLFRCSVSDDPASAGAALRTEVNHMIGRSDNVEIVLDYDDGVPLVDELVQHVEELSGVLEVEPSRGLIEDIERPTRSAP